MSILASTIYEYMGTLSHLRNLIKNHGLSHRANKGRNACVENVLRFTSTGLQLIFLNLKAQNKFIYSSDVSVMIDKS